MLGFIWLTTEDHLSRGQSNLNVMLYLFNYLFFGNTLTSDNTLFGAMSCELLFIFDHPIICRTAKYIGQSENSLLLKCVLYHVHTCTAVVSYRLVYMHQVPEKLYLGQWSYIAKLYPVNAIWLLKIEPVHDKCFKYLSSNATCVYCPKFSVSV